MPRDAAALNIGTALADTLEELLKDGQEEGQKFLAEATSGLATIVETLLAGGGMNSTEILLHAKARLSELGAIHLAEFEESQRQEIFARVLGVLRGALVVLAAG